jgi:hypothetical protein
MYASYPVVRQTQQFVAFAPIGFCQSSLHSAKIVQSFAGTEKWPNHVLQLVYRQHIDSRGTGGTPSA